jgi:hypothetical protein
MSEMGSDELGMPRVEIRMGTNVFGDKMGF